jgi:hypothetical protein
MMNATAIREAQSNPNTTESDLSSALAKFPRYTNTSTEYVDLPAWITLIANVGFSSANPDSIFKPVRPMNATQQLSLYKFLPSLSSSPSFLTHLHSTSVPLVSTMHTTWLSSRIVPWLHFVPMNHAFTDIYAILDCFIGNGKASSGAHGEMVRHGAHDEEAMRIATEGKEWAERVVRREDMLVYLGRGSSGEGYMGDIEALESQLGHIARIRSDETAETILL